MQYQLSHVLPYFEEAADHAHHGYFAFNNASLQLLYINPAVEIIFNRSIAEISTKPESILEMVHPDDREHVIEAYRGIKKGKRKVLEFRINSAEKELRWLKVAWYSNNKEAVVVGVVEDITSRRENEDLMKKFASKKDSVLEILSHDLAGPLTKIKGAASLMTEELERHNHPMLEKMVNMIEETTERSIRLIREFVKHEFIQSKNSILIKERENIVDTMREIMEQYNGSAREVHKKFKFTTSQKSIFLEMDAYKINQVVNNLISNAIKFTRDEGQISVALEERKDTVLLSVADDGIGIPAKYHKSLFERFTEARRPGLKGEPSVGLGMSIIKTIVEWHGGKIWLHSVENEGTTFYIELPKE
ncbi:PAS domain-containing sensor histidine kinase [Fulvivirga imtechensis]|nr:PAS domain-containing sensor histidine kinase [Fulvivirga imtechensis]